MLKNDIKHILRQKQTGFFCKHKKAALSMIKLFHVFLMQPEDERHYILDKNNLSGKGIILCGACYQYYETKRGTLRATCKPQFQDKYRYYY